MSTIRYNALDIIVLLYRSMILSNKIKYNYMKTWPPSGPTHPTSSQMAGLECWRSILNQDCVIPKTKNGT